MKTKFIEAHDADEFNWGKFAICRFDEEEWARRSAVLDVAQLRDRGWSPNDILFIDLQTGEGTILNPHGYAPADLANHAIWVCPMAQPFLEWLYRQDLSNLDKLPEKINLGKVPTALRGYRRPGVLAFLAELREICLKHGMKLTPIRRKTGYFWKVQILQENDPFLEDIKNAAIDKRIAEPEL
jgi:hypothetical protein